MDAFATIFPFFDSTPSMNCLLYTSLKKKVADSALDAPSVMLNVPYGDSWFMPSTQSYAARLIADAGGHYVYQTNTGNASVPIDMEEAYLLASDADMWLNVGMAVSYTHLQWISSDGRNGWVDYLSAYHTQDYYYPAWISENSYTPVVVVCVELMLTVTPSNGALPFPASVTLDVYKRQVCHSHTDTANLRVVLYIVPSEKKIIAVIGLDDSRRPQSTAQPWDIFL